MISGTGLLLAFGLVALLGLAVVVVWRVYRTPPGYLRSHQEDLPLFSVSLVESRRSSSRPQPAVAAAATNGLSAAYSSAEPSRTARSPRARKASGEKTRSVADEPKTRPNSAVPVSPPAQVKSSHAPLPAPSVPAVQATAPARADYETATPPASAAPVRQVQQPNGTTPQPQVERRADTRPDLQAESTAQIVSDDGVPGTQIEGHLLRFSVPQDGTLQFLPGRLEILNGLDAGREVRFVRVPGADGTHVTFGRSEGPAYRHVQLREGTVSRQHARMELRESQWHLTNLSATNPVVYNEQVLAVREERPLTDGDRIEMGEVVFGFRSR